MTDPDLELYTTLSILDDENRLDDEEKIELQSLKSKLEEKLAFYNTYNSNEAHSSACASTVNAILQQENQKLKEELNQLLNNPDFSHYKECGICRKPICKVIDEISCENIKSARLCYVCSDCDTLKEKLERIKSLEINCPMIVMQLQNCNFYQNEQVGNNKCFTKNISNMQQLDKILKELES